jgi:hypothetical protein
MIDTFSTRTFELCSTGKIGMNLMFFPEVKSISDETITLKKRDDVIMVRLYDEEEISMTFTHLYNRTEMERLINYIINSLSANFNVENEPKQDTLSPEATEFMKKCNTTALYDMLDTFKDAMYLGLIGQDERVFNLLDELPPREAW